MQFVNMSSENVFLQRTITALLWLAGVYAFFRWLLSPLLPFLLALGLSALLEPAVQRLRRALRVRRSFAAAVVTTAALVVAGGSLTLLAFKLRQELAAWSQGLPELLAGLPGAWNGLLDRVEGWYAACPGPMRSALDGVAQQVDREGLDLIGAAGKRVMDAASALLSALPRTGLFLVTTVLAVYFTSLGYPAILAFLKRQLPRRGRKSAGARRAAAGRPF